MGSASANSAVATGHTELIAKLERTGLPAPRLQLRWVSAGQCEDYPELSKWSCHYELVIPVDELDVRSNDYTDGERIGVHTEVVVAMGGPTTRTSGCAPCSWDKADTPFRDGVHAQRDSLVLGGLPIFVIAPDGTAYPVENKLSKTAALSGVAARMAEDGPGRDNK